MEVKTKSPRFFQRFSFLKIIKGRKIIWILAVVVPTLAASVMASFFYFKWQQASSSTPDDITETQEESQEEIDKIVEKVGRLILLPEGETPTLVTIDDKDSITENLVFFRDAENGDKVLVYRQAKLAFLYRPSADKLINASSVNVTSGEDADGTSADGSAADSSGATSSADLDSALTAEQTFRLAVRNSTSQSGLASSFRSQLLTDFANRFSEVVSGDATGQETLSKSLLIVKNDQAAALADELSTQYSLDIGSLPAGEGEFDQDLMIVLGNDRLE